MTELQQLGELLEKYYSEARQLNPNAHLCANSDYEECFNKVNTKGDLCSDCEEKAFEAFINEYY